VMMRKLVMGLVLCLPESGGGLPMTDF
jgi:hypothetical protein